MDATRDSQSLGKVGQVDPGFGGHVLNPAMSCLVFPKPILSDGVAATASFDAEGGHAPLISAPDNPR